MYSENSIDTNQNPGGLSLATPNDFSIGSDIDGEPDTFFIAIQVLAGTTETFHGSLNFTETN